jgi:ABC-type nitrate/sulfonate/bicarbonate transport system permease component
MTRASAIRLWTIVAIVAALELVCRMQWVRKGLIVAPTEMVAELASLMQTAAFWSSVWLSARSICVAFVLAIVVGCVLGLVLHALPRARAALEPLISSWYALPFFVIYPLLIVLFGMNEKPIILIGFLYAVMAVIIGVINGLDRIPPVLTRTGRSLRISSVQQAWFVSLPAAAPYVFTGAKLAFGYSMTGVLGSEFILANAGYGYDIAFAYNNFADRKMYALLLFLLGAAALITVALERASRAVEHRSGAARTTELTNPVSAMSRVAASLVVIAILLAVWQATHLFVGSEALASPMVTFRHLVPLLTGGEFWIHVRETFLALGFALLLSCVLGALLGALVGMSATATQAVTPVLVTLYSLPKITLYPVVLLFFGVSFAAKVVFGAMYGVIPMMLIVINAIKSMNPALPKTARVMRLSKPQTLGTVVLPAMLPEVVTGIRISFSITFLGVTIGEMFGSTRGLGFVLMRSINVNDTPTLMGVTLLVAVFAVTINAGLVALDKSMRHA